jgi:hypothetical protein
MIVTGILAQRVLRRTHAPLQTSAALRRCSRAYGRQTALHAAYRHCALPPNDANAHQTDAA